MKLDLEPLDLEPLQLEPLQLEPVDSERDAKKAALRAQMTQPAELPEDTIGKAQMAGAAGMGDALGAPLVTVGRAKESVDAAAEANRGLAMDREERAGMGLAKLVSGIGRTIGGKLTEASRAAETVAASTPGNETVAKVANAVGSGVGSMPYSIVPGVGPVTGVLAAGAQSYEGTRREVSQTLQATGVPEDVADRVGHNLGMSSGLITGTVTAAFNKFGPKFGLGKGVERTLGDTAGREAGKVAAKELLKDSTTKAVLKALFREAAGEGAEEATDQALQEAIVTWQYNPNWSLWDSVKNVAEAGALGAVAGGVVGGGPEVVGTISERRATRSGLELEEIQPTPAATETDPRQAATDAAMQRADADRRKAGTKSGKGMYRTKEEAEQAAAKAKQSPKPTPPAENAGSGSGEPAAVTDAQPQAQPQPEPAPLQESPKAPTEEPSAPVTAEVQGTTAERDTAAPEVVSSGEQSPPAEQVTPVPEPASAPEFTPASPEDLGGLRKLAAEVGLPTANSDKPLVNFVSRWVRKVGSVEDIRADDVPAITEQLRMRPARKAVEAAEKRKAVTYEDWAKQYRQAFRDSMQYSPDQVGSSTFTEKMAKLADEHPEFLARLEREEEQAAPKPVANPPAIPESSPAKPENAQTAPDSANTVAQQEGTEGANADITRPDGLPLHSANEGRGQGDLAALDVSNPHIADAVKAVVDRIIDGDFESARRILNNRVRGGEFLNDADNAAEIAFRIADKLDAEIAKREAEPAADAPGRPLDPFPTDQGAGETVADGKESQAKDAAQMFGLRSSAKTRHEFETAIADAVQAAANGDTIYDPETDVEWSIHHHVTSRGDRVTTVESGGGKSQFQVIQRQNGDRTVSGGKHMAFGRDAVLNSRKQVPAPRQNTQAPPDSANTVAQEKPTPAPLAELRKQITGSVERGEATPIVEQPRPISKGDWISYTDAFGKTRTGMVKTVWQKGTFVPGQGASTPVTEYSVTDAKGNYLPSPAAGAEVTRVATPTLADPNDKSAMAEETLATLRTMLADTNAKLAAQGRVTDDRLEQSKREIEKAIAELETQAAEAQVATQQVSNENIGQQGTGSSGMDVREPAETGARTEPVQQAVAASGQGEPVGAPVGGETAPGGRSKRGRGVRRGDAGDTGPGGRPGNVGQPAGPAAAEGSGSDLPATRSVAEPPRTEADRNHVLPRDADWIPNGSKSRVRANLDAIQLVKKLEAEQRNPTPEEKAVLAQYVGWGGLKEVFDDGKAAYRQRPPWSEEQKREYAAWETNWGNLYDAVNSALTPDELAAASKSILNAHYTSREVINAVWKAVERLGFRGGRALEPSAGIGHFIGLTPEGVRAKTQWSAVELDNISSRILAKLYPEAKVQGVGFQDARLALNSQDLVISNVPFAKDGPIDKRYPRFSLHNYFFARALDLVKPGGIVAFITSDSTLDSASSRAAREYLAERADLVGAMRLPNTAFKRNAGTEVTTDVIFLRKRDNSAFAGKPFLRTELAETHDGKPIEVNEYYRANPEMLLGRLSLEGTMYRADQPALLPTPGADLSAQMAQAAELLPANVLGSAKVSEAAMSPTADKGDKIGGLVFKDGEPKLVNGDGTLAAPEWAGTPKKKGQALLYVSLREKLRELVIKQATGDATNAELDEDRKTLNALYDGYVKRYGPVNARASQFLDDDVDFPMVLALEDGETRLEPTGKGNRQRKVTTWTKSRIFRERTIFPREAPTKVDTVADALQVALNYRGSVDVPYLAELTGQTEEFVRNELERDGLAFENPASGQWETRAQYLSGMVKAKLASARMAAEDDERFRKHVAELEKVQPAPIAAENIGFKLGSVWIPENVIERFLSEKLNVGARVSFEPITGKWHVAAQSGYYNETNKSLFGVHGWRGDELVAESLNLKSAVVEDDLGEGKKQKNPTKSLEAQEKQSQLQKLFREWAMGTPEVASRLEQIYNERYNGMVPQKFEAPTWSHYPGASQDITLREHQKAVVSRMLQNSTLLAHAVGTGKTFAITTAAMEMRRLGLAKKPMVVVQNATLEQFARSFKRLYPAARVLAPNSKQRDAKNRNKTMSRIATGDWDVVIVPQPFINLMPDDPKRETAYIRDEIAKLEAARIEAAASEGKRSPKASDLQKAIDRLEERLTDLANRKVDNVLTFEQLGVDALFVDEAHAYKKLQFTTQMDSIKGLDKGASQRGFSMMMKARWIQERNQGRNVIFATGTPVSNTIAEAWTMMRYLRPDLLKTAGIENFDAFASTFGDTVTQLEMTPGGNWKPVTRFARYTNGPELIAIWRTVADVVTPEEVNLPGLPALKGGRPQAVTVKQSPQIAAYVKYLREELERFANMSGKEKRENSHIPLVVFGLAKKASLDMRMINPDLEDQPGSKLNVAADQIARIWKDSEDVNGAQMVFADSFQDDPDNPRFNLYDEMKRKLVARGIPEKEIVILTADIKDEKRDQIFTRLRDGEIRVALGSTERMGVGVNAQDHLIALHHLDAPPRPMDVEQRNGRILRQGNQNPEIEIISYGVENTLDAAMFQKLATKQKFINQILRGDIQGRGFEDAANEQSLTFEEQMAAFSGDKRAMEKVSLENQVRQLEALKQGHINQLRQARDNIQTLTERTIPYQTKRLNEAQRLKQMFAAAFDGETYTLEANGKRASGRKDVVALLDKVFDRVVNDTLASAKNAFGDQTFAAGEITLNGQEISMTGVARADQAGIIMPEMVAIRWLFKDGGNGGTSRSGVGFFTSLASVLERIQAEPDMVARSLANEQRNLRELSGFAQQPFEREAELKDARGKLDALMTELEAEAKAQASPMQTAEPPGGWTEADKVPKLSGGMSADSITPERAEQIRRQTEQGGFITPPDLSVLVDYGRRVASAIGDAGRVFTSWSAEMLRRLGNGVESLLGSIWSRMRARDLAASSGLTPEAQAALNRIDAHANEATDLKPQAPPVYDADKIEKWWTKLMNEGARIRFFGSDRLLAAKRGLELETAYQAAAVKKQAQRLADRLFESAYANDPKAQRFPRWFAKTIPPERMRRFLRYALPIAAHLNVTGGLPGAWTFGDFDMRAGFLTERAAADEGVTTGGTVFRANPLTGEVEELRVGDRLKLDNGRRGFQLLRPLDANLQAQIYEQAKAEFPEFTWLLDQYVDPALASAREEINGVSLPVFNRLALAQAYAEADPTFKAREAYTPDVSVAGAWGAAVRYVAERGGNIGAALNRGVRSPGRKYDTGEARERGVTKDLISGFAARSFQVLQERERRKWREAVFREAVPQPNGVLPEGWASLDTEFGRLWDALKRVQSFDDPVNFPQTTDRLRDDESPEYKAFFGELMRLKGQQLMIPKALVDSLVTDAIGTKQEGVGIQLANWWAKNWKAGLLLMPDTFIENRTDNYLRFLMAAQRQFIAAALQGGNRLAFRQARKLAAGAFANVVPGFRQAFDLNRNRLFNQFVEDVMPEEVFGGQTRLVDLGLEGDTPLEKLKRGEVGPAILEATGYGNIDVAAKQQFAWTLLQAKAELEARSNGLRGEEAEAYIAAWLLNPPQEDRLAAVSAANTALLNYGDTPHWLAKFARNPIGNTLVAFPLYRYHFIGREIDRATGAFRAFYQMAIRGKSLTPAQRTAALADSIAYVTLPAMGYGVAKVLGALADSVIRDRLPDDDDEDPREFVGSSERLDVSADGKVTRKPLPRELITANRLNLSSIARLAGVETGPDDLWWNYKDYPLVRSAALFYQATEDARTKGVGEGTKTLFQGMSEMLGSLAGTGQGIKVPARLVDEMKGQENGTGTLSRVVDPYGARVPLSAYLTLQALNLVPFNRQADEVLKWLDPTRRRITESKTLGYSPGVSEAVRLGGVTGLGAQLLGQREDLPASGPINRKFGFVERPTEFSLAARIAAAFGQNIKPVNRDEYREALAE